MIEKTCQTVVDISVGATIVVILLAILGRVDWRWIFAPLLIGLTITIIIRLGAGIYARYK